MLLYIIDLIEAKRKNRKDRKRNRQRPTPTNISEVSYTTTPVLQTGDVTSVQQTNVNVTEELPRTNIGKRYGKQAVSV